MMRQCELRKVQYYKRDELKNKQLCMEQYSRVMKTKYYYHLDILQNGSKKLEEFHANRRGAYV